MTVTDRTSLARALGTALSASDPARELTVLLRGMLVPEPTAWESDGEHLVRRIAERLDAVGNDRDRLVALARDTKQLLEGGSSAASVELLFELIAERNRFLHIIEKHADGTVSRTSLLAYLSEQRWAPEVRRRLVELTARDLSSLMAALRQPDVPWLEEKLLA